MGANGLDFGNLPLVEVTLRVAPSFLLPTLFMTQHMMYAHLLSHFPVGRTLWEPFPGFGTACLPLDDSRELGFKMITRDGLVTVVFQANLLAVQWKVGGSGRKANYPRYAELRSCLGKLMGTLQGHAKVTGGPDRLPYRASNITYTNQVKTKERACIDVIRDYINSDYLPPVLKGEDHFSDLNLCWKDAGKDFRYKVKAETLGKGHGFTIETSAGRFHEDDEHDALDYLDESHDLLQKRFKELLTEKALKRWKYKEEDAKSGDAHKKPRQI